MLNDEEAMALFVNNYLDLIILPTEDCNFSCSYCYEYRMNARMKKDCLEAVLTLVKNRKDLEFLRVRWFGGEPLLEINTILEFTQRIENEISPRVKTSYEMTTNGYLLNRINLERLLNAGINKYQISIDGPKQFHDRTRRLRNGNGTYDVIWKNIKDILASQYDIEVIIRLHITKYNALVYLDYLNDTVGILHSDSRFKIFPKAITNLGGDIDQSAIMRYERCIDLEKAANATIPECNLRISEPTPICYAAMPNSFVIRPDGRLAKCTIGLDDEINMLGRISTENGMQVDNGRYQLWIKSALENNANAMECPRKALTS